jgi:hypothetical protein
MDVLLLNLLKWLAALAIPALLAMFVPRRWLVATLATWALLPALIFLVLFLGEVARAPSELAEPDKIFLAFLFYGGFLIVPWFVMSAMGSAVGLALRRRGAPPAAPAPTHPRAPAAMPPQAPAPQAAHPPGRPEWRARHIGFERDGLILDGLDVWGGKWRRVGSTTVELPHPAHPLERHRFEVYEAGEGARARQFAATELSNGVWGFYTRVGAEDPRAGTSTDGSLGFENRYPDVAGRHSAALAPTGRIWRVATGEVLADGSGWASSRVIPEASGSLQFALRHFNNDALFRLRPQTASFSVVGERREDEPLGRLAEAVDRALRESIDRAQRYLGLRLSPDGSIRVELATVEWSNTHWVNAPRVTEVATGRVLLDLWNTDWDAEVSFPFERTVALDLRRYHAGGRCQAILHLATGRFAIFEDTPGPPILGPLAELGSALESASRRSSARARRAAGVPRRIGQRQLLVALAILVAALGAIGGISFVVVKLTPAPAPTLSTVPAMPR